MPLLFTPTGNEAEDRKIRRMYEAGNLERIANGIYYEARGESKEVEIRRNWQKLVAKLVPGGVVTDRTGIETKPIQFSAAGPHNVYVSAPRSRATIELPGLSIHVRNGLGPMTGDIQYLGTHLAGQERRLLDNLTPSRARDGQGARTLGEAAVEAKLDEWCRTSGAEFLNGIRDRARELASFLGRELEFKRLNGMIGTLLNTHQGRIVTPQGRARAAGTPVDVACLDRFAKLLAYMADRAPHTVLNQDTTPDRVMAGSFVEAYFSNYIEGTEFAIEEATEIVYGGKIPEDRPEDGHDVLGTYLQLVYTGGRSPSATTFDEFKDEIRTRHAQLMESRPSVRPGQFKTIANRAGDTSFVAPDVMEGTLKEGHAILRSIDDPFRRALFLHYMMAEVHPFNDGNGRISRILMTRELMSAGLSRIVIPTVFRDDYLDAMRALSRRDDPSILVRSLEFCQRVSAACSASSSSEAIEIWARAYAFCENPRQAKLTMPNPALEISSRGGIYAPEEYWRALEGTKNGNPFGMG
ncbi:Fic family protein [Rhizobium leguminosarum]|uniref:Fic family protein n=1 Tax=Rhizobium leguminosarum TaxID=384 RepID=UPI001AE4A7EC|nr:Fic family protein [Rhizobium leguminosarum]MBP2448626.1 hypothetical protein [Rhizobium leguminosarum]